VDFILKTGASNSIKRFLISLRSRLFPFVRQGERKTDHYELYTSEIKKLNEFIISAQNLFISTLDQKILLQARRFPYCRWNYYKYLEKFSHHRIEQLLHSCPGLISILCISVKENIISKNDHNHILNLIKNGVALKKILIFLFECLYNSNYEYWSDFRIHSSSRKEKARTDWIWTLINASSSTGANYLIFPPAFFLCKSDLPKKNRERADWIKRTKMFKLMIVPEETPEIPLNQVKGLILMISKSGNNSYKYMNKKRVMLKEFLIASKKTPNSKTNYVSFFKEVQKFKKDEFHIERSGRNQLLIDAKINIEMNQGRILQHDLYFSNEQISIKALTHLQDLKEESVKMNNCVKEQWHETYLKIIIFFHVEILRNQYTLSVDPKTKNIIDFKGIKNSSPTAEHTNILIHHYFGNLEKFDNFFTANSGSPKCT